MTTYPSIDAFYSANEQRRHSGELDFGVWWREKPKSLTESWRISFVKDTREFYAIASQSGRVDLLGQIPEPDDDVPDNERYPAVYRIAEKILDGWPDAITEQGLAWARARIAMVTA